jgi:hypothetical protein
VKSTRFFGSHIYLLFPLSTFRLTGRWQRIAVGGSCNHHYEQQSVLRDYLKNCLKALERIWGQAGDSRLFERLGWNRDTSRLRYTHVGRYDLCQPRGGRITRDNAVSSSMSVPIALSADNHCVSAALSSRSLYREQTLPRIVDVIDPIRFAGICELDEDFFRAVPNRNGPVRSGSASKSVVDVCRDELREAWCGPSENNPHH